MDVPHIQRCFGYNCPKIAVIVLQIAHIWEIKKGQFTLSKTLIVIENELFSSVFKTFDYHHIQNNIGEV